jgi:predicted amino acid racemase
VQVNKINELDGLTVAGTVSINCLNCRLARPVEQIANLFYATVQVNKINELDGLTVAGTVSINCLNCRLAHPVEQIANLFYAND